MSAHTWISHAAAGGVPDYYARYLAGEPLGAGDLARRCPDLDALATFARGRLGAGLPDALSDALAERARRLGGSEATQHAITETGAGRAVFVFAGQQPGLLAGPLYTLHKAATAVAAARALTARGVPAFPAFWIASDDADLDETGTVYAPGPDRGLRKARLQGTYEAGTLAGDVPVGENDAAFDTLFPDASDAFRARIARMTGAAEDLGDFLAVLLHRAFGADGIVPVDSRTVALREAAAPLVRRYLDVHAQVAERVNAAGDELEPILGTRPLHESSAQSALFEIDTSGRRMKIESPEAAQEIDAARLSAGVVLRPFVQEHVFPTAGFVVGPGELAYLVQSESAAELLGVERSPFVPRLAATWIDDTLVELAEIAGGWEALIQDPAPAVEARVRRELPDRLVRALTALREATTAGFAEIEAFAEREGDKGLAQIGEASRKKADYQIGRVESHALDRARKAAAARGLVLTNVAEFLRPRKGGQERTLSTLWPLDGMDAPVLGARAVAAATLHLESLSLGTAGHALIRVDAEDQRAKEESWGERCESA